MLQLGVAQKLYSTGRMAADSGRRSRPWLREREGPTSVAKWEGQPRRGVPVRSLPAQAGGAIVSRASLKLAPMAGGAIVSRASLKLAPRAGGTGAEKAMEARICT